MYVTQKISPGDMKDKIEQQLRLQREANNKRRAEDLKQGEDSLNYNMNQSLDKSFLGQPQFKTVIRKTIVRNADGTTRVISETSQQVPTSKPSESPQKIQVMRGPDGKMSVRGLQANQKLVQTAEGKYLILPANQAGKKNLLLRRKIKLSNLSNFSCRRKGCAARRPSPC